MFRGDAIRDVHIYLLHIRMKTKKNRCYVQWCRSLVIHEVYGFTHLFRISRVSKCPKRSD